MATRERHSGVDESNDGPLEDTALSALTPEDRERLAMDAWEPTLLRKLLEAENKLPRKAKSTPKGSC